MSSQGISKPWNIASYTSPRSFFKTFSPGNRKKRLRWSPLSDVLSRLMALPTHNLPSVSLKKRQVKSTKRCFMVFKDHANTFCHPGPQKKRFERRRLIDVLCRWTVLRTHNLPCGHLKKLLLLSRLNDFWRCKAMRNHFLHFSLRKN
jgi:hypothetical protein